MRRKSLVYYNVYREPNISVHSQGYVQELNVVLHEQIYKNLVCVP